MQCFRGQCPPIAHASADRNEAFPSNAASFSFAWRPDGLVLNWFQCQWELRSPRWCNHVLRQARAAVVGLGEVTVSGKTVANCWEYDCYSNIQFVVLMAVPFSALG